MAPHRLGRTRRTSSASDPRETSGGPIPRRRPPSSRAGSNRYRGSVRRPHRRQSRSSHTTATPAAYPGGGLTTGYLALVGGDEFKPGNEEHDRLLVAQRGAGAAYAVPTAAARQRPEQAVATAQRWFGGLG